MGPFHVAIAAIIAFSISSVLMAMVKSKKEREEDDKLSARVAEQESQIQQLTERVQTLEKLVTDDNFALKKEFQKL